jgi:hypothetical protein
MILVQHRLRFPAAVLCAGPAGVFFASGIDVEGNPGAGIARMRATDTDGRPFPFSVLVDLRELPRLRRICETRGADATLPVAGGTSISGCDEEGNLVMRVQGTLSVERDSLGVLVLAPGPDIPWTLGVHADAVDPFICALEDCVACAPIAAVA